MKRVGLAAAGLYLALIYIFVLGPMMFVIVASFNSATSFPSSFEGLTFRWYRAIFAHREFIAAAWSSTVIAALSGIVATAAAFLAAYAMSRGRGKENPLLSAALASPMLVPQIVLSLGLLQLAARFGIGGSFDGLVAAHAVHGLPFALRLAMTGFVRFNFVLEEAALSLGAARWQTWRHITLPLLRPSLIAGFTFCFILSFVNLPISLFLTDAHTTTLPVVMFAYIESRIDPMLAAVSTILVVLAAAVTLGLEHLLRVRLVD
jgi:putative spermidine/putrescine transport system permease protein